MNTKKMISDIHSTIAELEAEKTDLMNRVKAIDDDITAYKMAVDALELTRQQVRKVVEEVKTTAEPKIPQKDRPHERMIEYKGKTQSVSAWAREIGIDPKTLHYRLNAGWPLYEAMQPGKHNNRKKEHQKIRKIFSYDSHGNVIRQYTGVGDASRDLNLPESTVQKIIDKMTKEDQLRCRNYYLAYAS